MGSPFVIGTAAVALLLGTVPAAVQAQRIIIASRPIADRYAISYVTPVRAAAIQRAWPRAVTIARINHGYRDHGHGHGYGRMSDGWWRSNGYRPVTVYCVDGRYYDRWDDRYRGRNVRQEVVYERGGRLYRDWDDDNGYSRDDRGGYGNGGYGNGGYGNGGYDRNDRDDHNRRDDRDDHNRRDDRDDRSHRDDRDDRDRR